MRGPFITTLIACVGLTACGGGPVETPIMVFDAGFGPTQDGGPADTGTLDSATPDTGRLDTGVDAGTPDTGVDAGTPDTGVAAGTPDTGMDAGPDTGVDAGPDTGVDAGTPDTGVDAGQPDTGVDAGQPDTGVDAGQPDTGVDAGRPDTGVDAGQPDTGVDAGQPDAGQPDTGVDAGQPDTGVPGAIPTSYTSRSIDSQIQHGQHVGVVDIDNDGDMDVVGSISLTDTVRVYLNGGNSGGGGNGTVWQAVQVAPNNSIVAMGTVVADFDNDTDLDVVGVGLFQRNPGFNSVGNLTLYRQGATATNWTSVPINVGANFWGPRIIAAGDFTGDGFADLVTGAIEMYDTNGNVVGHGVRWHRNTTTNFALPIDIDAALADVDSLVVADIDRDGVPDIVAGGRNTGVVVWYENSRVAGQVDASPTFTRHVLAAVFQPGHIAMAQMDADPELELVVAHDDGSAGELAWYDPPANPRAPWARNLISSTFGGSSNVIRIAAGDLNADGFTDIVTASAITNQVRAFVRTANGWSDQLVRGLNGATCVEIGDLSGDGRDDIMSTTYLNGATTDRTDWYQTVP